MSRAKEWMFSVVGSLAIMTSSVAVAQSFQQPSFQQPSFQQPSFQQAVDSPAARMRPIGSASAVDQYRQRPVGTVPAILRETGYRNAVPNQQSNFESGSVRQTAMQFTVPGGAGLNVGPPVTSPAPNFNPPGAASFAPLPPGPVPQSGPSIQQGGPSIQQGGPFSQPVPPMFGQQGQPQANFPASLPFPGTTTAVPIRPRTDYAPMNAPSLGGSISNINNCANVTGPSGYSAAFSSPCGSCAPVAYQAPAPQNFQAPQGFQAPPAQIAAPAIVPGAPLGAPAFGAQAAINPAPVGSLLTFGQERYPVQVGQGLLGQPTAYVPGQTFRNWLRYFTP